MKTLLVTGASGLLGLNLCLDQAAAGRYRVVGQANRHALQGAPFPVLQADLARPGEFARLLAETRADTVVHTAALANLDACEKDPAASTRVNAELPGEVAEACRRAGARLAHLSTDSVFDGATGGYREDDRPNPQGVYAQDKLAGELAVRSANPEAVIARVNFYGWSLSGGRSLSEFFYNNLSAGRRVNGFTDVFFCPLVANRLGEILLEMLERGLQGVFHVLSGECQSKYAFGVALARRFGFDDGLVTPISVAESGLLARRSPNLTLSVAKLEAALGRALPGQSEGLERLHALWAEGRPQMLRAMEG
ncbi:MAG TPA: SDR family oxidoreductase [Anaerolinea sp.]|nr:SDR family oxidoreductase [Anaerolinea sp.]